MHTYPYSFRSRIFLLCYSMPPAVAVTALLVLVMHSLIASEVPLVIEKRTIVADIIRVDPEPPRLEKTDPAEKVDEPTPPPAWTSPEVDISPEGGELGWRASVPAPELDRSTTIDHDSGVIVAYLKPQPVYPSRLLSRGIEGYVDLAFDITAAGATTNIRVIDAQPPGVFDRAAVQALQRWKYKVPVIDGAPQGQVDMMTRMRFEIDE